MQKTKHVRSEVIYGVEKSLNSTYQPEKKSIKVEEKKEPEEKKQPKKQQPKPKAKEQPKPAQPDSVDQTPESSNPNTGSEIEMEKLNALVRSLQEENLNLEKKIEDAEETTNSKVKDLKAKYYEEFSNESVFQMLSISMFNKVNPTNLEKQHWKTYKDQESLQRYSDFLDLENVAVERKLEELDK